MQLSDRIGRRIKLHDLHVLMAVVQAGSMGKAALALNTGQSAISRSIASLEGVFGVPLLERTPQGVLPTAQGRALLQGGAAVFDDLRQTVRAMELLADPAAGELRIGCNHILAASFVSVAVDRLSQRYPRAAFRLVTAHVGEQQRALAERRLDILVARRAGFVPGEEVVFEPLFDETYAFVAGARNRWARRKAIDLADLADEPWVLPPPGSTSGSVALAAFRACGLEYPRAAVISELADVRTRLLAGGRFISVFPHSILRLPAGRPALRTLAVRQPLGVVPVGIVTPRRRALNPLVLLFMEVLRELAAEFRAQAPPG